MHTFLRLLCLVAPLCLISCSGDKPEPAAPQEKAAPENPIQDQADALNKAKDVQNTLNNAAAKRQEQTE